MTRTYRRKNAVAKGARLSRAQTMDIMFNYFCQGNQKLIATRLEVSEPTVHRTVSKLQQRLFDDNYFTACSERPPCRGG